MDEKENRPKAKSDGARVIQVIEVKTCLGKGTSEHPYRSITEYWSMSGDLLAVRDAADLAI